MLDCAAISHHNHNRPGRIEGLRLLADAEEGRRIFIDPVEEIAKEFVYFIGNHEGWLEDLIDSMPALEGIVDIKHLLKLNSKWQVIDRGGVYNLGKLTFLHGDTIKGGEHVAKAAVISYERSVRFGHFHTYQTYSKNSPLDYKNAKTGIAVPCLCHKTPSYGHGAPNRWVEGFIYGYVDDKGFYNDYVVTIIDGKFTVNGKVYCG